LIYENYLNQLSFKSPNELFVQLMSSHENSNSVFSNDIIDQSMIYTHTIFDYINVYIYSMIDHNIDLCLL